MKPEINLDTLLPSVCAGSFRFFVEHFWTTVSNDEFRGGYLVDAVCEHLQAVQSGQIKRLAIACPIRHGKSLLSSVLFPAWAWIHDPSIRMLTVSAGERLAQRDSLRSRQLILSPLYQKYYGQLYRLSDEQTAKSYYINNKFGKRVALGTGSNTNGEDADYIIADDILDYDKAKSELERQDVQDYYQGTLSQRLALGNNKDRIILVGHRVHEDDVFANIWNTYGNDGTWTYLVLPAEAKPSVTNHYFNATGWKDTRAEGELLNPERFGDQEINQAKKTLRHKYHCIFQQDPSPADGDLFRASWWRYYTQDEETYCLNGRRLKKADAWRFQTCDTAVSTKAGSDFTVVQTWDVIGDNMVLVDQFRKRLDGVRIVPVINETFKTLGPQFLAMEQEFVGRFVIDQLRAVGVVVKPFHAQRHGDKETRAIAAEIRCEAGKVWFPADAPWVADLEKELLSFPNGTHDDQVDAMSCACILADRYIGEIKEEPTPAELVEKMERKRQTHFERMLWAGAPF